MDKTEHQIYINCLKALFLLNGSMSVRSLLNRLDPGFGEVLKRFEREIERYRNENVNWANAVSTIGLGIGKKFVKGQPISELSLVVAMDFNFPSLVPDVPAQTLLPIPSGLNPPGSELNQDIEEAQVLGIPNEIVVKIVELRTSSYSAHNDDKYVRPAPPGCQIAASAVKGTLGGWVRLLNDDAQRDFVLSNKHVIGSLRGMTTYQPIKLNVMEEKYQLACFAQEVPTIFGQPNGNPFPNRVDAAIAEVIDQENAEPSYPSPIAPNPRGVEEPWIGMEVAKLGARSGPTTGIVSCLHFETWQWMLKSPGELEKAFFEDQFLVEPLGEDPFGEEGDSGSIVFDKSSSAYVGLYMGGTKFDCEGNKLEHSIGVCNRISNVFRELEIEPVV